MADRELFLEMAGISVRVVSDSPISDKVGMTAEYRTEPKMCELTYHTKLVDELPVPEGDEVYFSEGMRIFRSGDMHQRYIGSVSKRVADGHTCTRRTGKETVVYFRRSELPEGITGRIFLNAMELPYVLTSHDAFLLHASFIEYEGRAILFTAPSETGKSTQAQLWCDHRGAELVNGDRAAVRVIDGKIHACGVLFAGSSRVRKNMILPLAAIVYLSQAPENTITKLRGFRAFRSVWEGITLNTWDRNDVEKATQTLSTVLSGVPVYHLACTPDVRAVELLKQTLEVDL